MSFLFDNKPVTDRPGLSTGFLFSDDDTTTEVVEKQPYSWEQAQAETKRRQEQAKFEEMDARRPEDGFFGDIGRGFAGGVVRGGEMAARSLQWFGKEDSPLEQKSAKVAEYLQGLREDNPEWFAESKTSQEAREGSAWNPRGWFHSGFESIGMLAPGVVVGMFNPVAGAATVGVQFWGSTAQEAYDEAVENERLGKGRKLTEAEKIQYANLRGFWEGGIEAIQSRIPFGLGSRIFNKLLPRSAKQNLIRDAVIRPGNSAMNVAKDIVKTISVEVPMEMFQEGMGAETAYWYGQQEHGARWEDLKQVIGPTIVMSTVFGGMGTASGASQRKQLHDALTNENATQEDRLAAVQAIYTHVAKQDKELADMWLEQTADNLAANKPVALPLDDTVREGGEAPTAPVGRNDKLQEALEALEVEQAELDAVAAAQDEALVGRPEDQAPITEPPVQNPAAPEVMPESTLQQDPNLIEPEYDVPEVTLKDIDRRIDLLRTRIENHPNDPKTPALRDGLKSLKEQRAQLTGEKTSAATPAAGQSQDSSATVAGKPVTSPVTPEQAIAELKNLGAKLVIDGNERSWVVTTPEGVQSFAATKDIAGTLKQVQKALGQPDAEIASQGQDLAAEQQDAGQLEDKVVPVDDKGFKRSKDFKSEGTYEHPSAPGWKIFRDTQQFGPRNAFWAVVSPDGRVLDSSYSLLTKAEAVAFVNKQRAEQAAPTGPKGTKYSVITKGELAVDLDSIPTGLEVETNTGEGKTKMDAHKAVKSVDSLRSKLQKILECVRS